MFRHNQLSFVSIFREVGEIKIIARNLFVHSEHVLSFIFKMRGGIEAVRNEHSVIEVIFDWLIPFRYLDELFFNRPNNGESNLYLFLRVFCFHCCANYRNICVCLADTMHRRNHHNINIYNIVNNYHFFSLIASEEWWSELKEYLQYSELDDLGYIYNE